MPNLLIKAETKYADNVSQALANEGSYSQRESTTE